MYPRGLFGVQLSVGQYGPRRAGWLAGRQAAPQYNWRPLTDGAGSFGSI